MENDVKIPVEVSAKHIHLTQEHVDILFGKGYQLTHKSELSQPGFFVTNEKVEVIGKKGSANFSILVPLRSKTQVEIAITDAIKLGLDVVVRDSGDLADSAPCKLKGPAGEVDLEEGVIVASRHIHLNDENAQKLGVKDKDLIKVQVGGARGLTFENVLVRVAPENTNSMHIDTDEGNAANINNKIQTFGKKVL